MSTVSDFLVERLIAWGIRRMDGYPGDRIKNGTREAGATEPRWTKEKSE